jgi:Skp family chaperone for outer membrane proteins
MSGHGGRGRLGRALWILAIGGAALLGAAIPATATRNAGIPAIVCTIDLERVFEAAPRRAEMEAGLQARDAELKTEIEGKRKEIEKLKGELDLTRPGSDEHSRLQRELVAKQADLRFVGEQAEEEMERRVLELRDKLLGEIEKVVADVCEAQGYDIVVQREFKIPHPGDLEDGLLHPAAVRHHRRGDRRAPEGVTA